MKRPADERVGKAVGERVRALRKRAGLSLRGLAERSGVTHSAIDKLEKGLTPRPGVEALQKLAAALGVTLNYLLGDQGEGQETGDALRGVEELQVKLLRIGQLDRELGRERLVQLTGVIEAVVEQAEREYTEERRAVRRNRGAGPARPPDT
jgi:transcriptional regulator with XRE-family HTH domain